MDFGRIARRLVRPISGSRTDAPPRYPRGEITWTSTDHVMWIASHAAEYLGMVEEHDGLFVANDTSRGTYNTYGTLADAMQAFESPMENAAAA